MTDDPLVRCDLDIRDLGPRGLEVVASVVNEGEEPLIIRQASVEVAKDGVAMGRHPVSFREADHQGHIQIDQFEIAEGHFHLEAIADHHLLRFAVAIDCRRGAHAETRRISRRIETGRISREG